MVTLRISLPYIAWRDGRPRFQPSPQLRREGWKGEDLRHGPVVARPGRQPQKIGAWYTREEAVVWAADRAAAIQARRADLAKARAGRRRAPSLTTSVTPDWVTIEDLFEAWSKSPRMAGGEDEGRRRRTAVAAGTRRDYRIKTRVLADFDPTLWGSPVDALTKPIVYDLYERLWKERGLATARGVIAVFSTAISWGIRKGKVRLAVNPCSQLGMETPPPRVRCLTPLEVRALVAAADRIGRPEIGDAITLGVWTGQRQSDRLAMADGGTLDGRRVFRQQKTGAIVMIPDAPEVTARLEAMRARRREWTVQPIEVVIDEKRRVPFRREHYSHVFADVRAAAVAGCKDARSGSWIAEPVASLADARDQDLRDTAVTWLARSGCTLPEICQITGHSMQSAQQTLKHYLASHPQIADNAIKKLVAWMEGQG